MHENLLVAWVLCTGGIGVGYGGWPASGGQYEATFGPECYYPPGENAKIGYFTTSDVSPGTIALQPFDPHVYGFGWWSCEAPYRVPICEENLGAGSPGQGFTPLCGEQCGTVGVPIRNTSWGALKSLYR